MANIPTISFDAIIIGGGGAGMRAALQLAQGGHKTAVITKVFPTRSHTVSAQGGITCAIASADPNDDGAGTCTIQSGLDYIGDQALSIHCQEGPAAVYELDTWACRSRVPNRAASTSVRSASVEGYGKGGQAARTCAASDRTGHALLHTFIRHLKAVPLPNEYTLSPGEKRSRRVRRVIAICIETGETLHPPKAMFWNGGAGRIYSSTTNA